MTRSVLQPVLFEVSAALALNASSADTAASDTPATAASATAAPALPGKGPAQNPFLEHESGRTRQLRLNVAESKRTR